MVFPIVFTTHGLFPNSWDSPSWLSGNLAMEVTRMIFANYMLHCKNIQIDGYIYIYIHTYYNMYVYVYVYMCRCVDVLMCRCVDVCV